METPDQSRYGSPLAEVPWRLGRFEHGAVIYAQHGPLADDGDAYIATCHSEALAGYIVRLHNTAVRSLKGREARR